MLALTAPHPGAPRHIAMGAGVVLLHLAALWALQTGLHRGVVALPVPVVLVSEWVQPPRPQPARPPPVARPGASSKPSVSSMVPKAVAQPTPVPQAVADAPPSANAPTGTTQPAAALAPIAATGVATPVVAPAPVKDELPSSDADYLQNPKPAYPAMSKRLGEQGRVVVRVRIGADGVPLQAEIGKSSGFERLDQAALATTMRWRYVPGTRGGVPQSMWFSVPINFVLE